MQLYLRDFDDNYLNKSKDFYDVLKIIHRELNSLNNDELVDAIRIISELSSEIKDKYMKACRSLLIRVR